MEQGHRGEEALRAENEALRADNERLRTQIEEMQRGRGARQDRSGEGAAPAGSAEGQAAVDSALERSELLRSLLDDSPLLIFAKDLEGRYLFSNRNALAFIGLSWAQLAGRTDYEFFPKDLADEYTTTDRQVAEAGTMTAREETMLLQDGPHHFVTTKFPLRDSRGQIQAVASVSADITVYKRAEEENRRLQDEIIRVQEMSLRALSTPLLPIAMGVVVMPLIGNVDRGRAQRVVETLLDGIVRHEATTVILDVTGVPVVDTEVANALVMTARAVRLLGARVILTGIQPSIAQTLVSMGADLNGVITEGTLESGIARTLRRTRA